LEYFKYNKNDPYEGIQIMEKIVVSNYLFVSESVDDYLSEKRLTKRRIIILLFHLCVWTFALKSLLVSYYNKRSFLIMTGDFTYLYPMSDALNITLFLILIGITIGSKNSL